MLSTYVIQSVHVLLELDKVSKMSNSPRRLAQNDFGVMSQLQRPVLRRVLRTLIRDKFIAISNSRTYSAVRHPDDITLLELVQLFHGDVCVGESYDHYLAMGRENFPTNEYLRLLEYEQTMKKTLIDKWLKMPISMFKSKDKGDGQTA